MTDEAPRKSRPSLLSRARLGVATLLVVAALVGYFAVFRVRIRGGGVAAGERAAAFVLPDELGGVASLDALTAHGPAVIFFYRGHW